MKFRSKNEIRIIHRAIIYYKTGASSKVRFPNGRSLDYVICFDETDTDLCTEIIKSLSESNRVTVKQILLEKLHI